MPARWLCAAALLCAAARGQDAFSGSAADNESWFYNATEDRDEGDEAWRGLLAAAAGVFALVIAARVMVAARQGVTAPWAEGAWDFEACSEEEGEAGGSDGDGDEERGAAADGGARRAFTARDALSLPQEPLLAEAPPVRRVDSLPDDLFGPPVRQHSAAAASDRGLDRFL
eukprot:TRINITY_DN30420_c0_g1_i1.p2 TRINITY_DN30420_c0_g1~~TRINITY_DN30420_c0_g1_i1.p2  ORF type:complete len:171 (+),score=53.32 TRINITY_DN30420_c0_g1_i1:81-593(+)